MTRLVGLVAVASWFAAPPTGAGNRPGTHIAESTDLELGLSTLGFQRGERIGHRNASSFLAYYYSRIKATKKRTHSSRSIHVAHPEFTTVKITRVVSRKCG